MKTCYQSWLNDDILIDLSKKKEKVSFFLNLTDIVSLHLTSLPLVEFEKQASCKHNLMGVEMSGKYIFTLILEVKKNDMGLMEDCTSVVKGNLGIT